MKRDMVPLRLYPPLPEPENTGFSALADRQKDLLNRLRVVALGCRAAARTDLFEACAVLSGSKQTAKNAHVEVLMRCLSQALLQTPVMFRPNVEEISFDEAWLLRAVGAAAIDDWDSFGFLVRSRVSHKAQRNLGSLLVSISHEFPQT